MLRKGQEIMIYFTIVFILISLYNIKFDNVSGFDEAALLPKRTIMINGIFVIIVLFNHFFGYVHLTNETDLFIKKIITIRIDQLMVATFLFYSGYGIYESIKYKSNYFDTFLKNRFLKVYIPFFIAIILFIIMNLILQIKFPIKTVLLSFIGWKAIGNSNWFMFYTFFMYVGIYISFKIFKNKHKLALILIFLFSLIYIYMSIKVGKKVYWYNTSLCFPFGMLFSCYKDKLLKILKNNNLFYIIFIFLLFLFLIVYKLREEWLYFNFSSVIFVIIITLFSFKIKIGNKILYWIGKNTFNIYILQRISYIIFKHFGIDKINIYLYFLFSTILTIEITLLFNKLIKKIYRLVNI